jgi:lipopolysaccharide export system permease protein
LSVLRFQRDTIDLDQFAGPARATLRKTSERFLGELLWPAPAPGLTPRIRHQLLAEAHNRLSQPLYCIAFALIAMAAVLRGRRQRGPVAMRLLIAAFAAGYGVQGAAQGTPALIVTFYLIPLIGAAGAILVLMGYSPRAVLARRRIRLSGAGA